MNELLNSLQAKAPEHPELAPGDTVKVHVRIVEGDRERIQVIQGVEEAGGLPVLIPISIGDEALRDIYERLDGVLLPGGGDMRPNIYGAEMNPRTDNIDDARDHIEVNLTRWAFNDDVPVLGI